MCVNAVGDTSIDDDRQRGFDAAVKRREDDYLDRWPFARELYGIAVRGPLEWSTRIGVYGEWGTGKTSVLEFVAAMAKAEGHIVIWFNPWEHSTKDALWCAFVLKVMGEPVLRNIKGARKARIKGQFRRLWQGTKFIEAGVQIVHDKTGKLVGTGLDLVRKLFSFSADDLKALRDSLGEKRVLILIDDLDRTAPELVPEILFALKELMNTPSFSFICAFDPGVVGQVLGDYHKGFGDGLKFLDKIIDYPRRLPPAPQEGLINLAVSEAKRLASYVPEQALRDAVPLLPANPRAVRQFIRLLTLLRPQIERHYDRELHWPIILAANVIKIRYPRQAQLLLRDESFWERIDQTPFLARDGEERVQIEREIDNHIARVESSQGTPLEPAEREEIKTALRRLCLQLDRWALRTTSFIGEQMGIAEAPHAVTWKEYDQFLELWSKDQRLETPQNWIALHATKVQRTVKRVYNEILEATLVAYAKELREADGAFVESDRTPHEKKAESLIALIDLLIFELGQLDSEAKLPDPKQLNRLFETVASFSGATTPVQSRHSARNEQLLVQLIARWSGDLTPLMDVIHPYQVHSFTHYEGRTVRVLHHKLCAAILPKFARGIIQRFREPGFVDHLMRGDSQSYNMRSVLLDPGSALWKDLFPETRQMLSEAGRNRSIQENAYGVLEWFNHQLREQPNSSETETIRKLLGDANISKSLWSAATATRLASAAAFRIYRLPEILNSLGVNVEHPDWWTEAAQPFLQRETQRSGA